MVWSENEEGGYGTIARKWEPTYRDMVKLFGDECHPQVLQDVQRFPNKTCECLHIIVEADMFDEDAKGAPYFSIYYDKTHDKKMESVGVYSQEYVIPRWQTVSGSQYAFSPATIVGLPDGRLIQAMTYTLLEAGEKATNPPIVATEDAVRSDIAIYAGGITWVDQEYDEKLGQALRPLTQDLSGLPMGVDMLRDSRALLKEAFFLNKLTLPERGGPDMTAYEVGQRVQEYIRAAMPIFEPMEMSYNGALCEETFDVLMRGGAFGPMDKIPKALRGGAEYQFRFESPLHDAIEQQKGQKWLEAKSLIADAAALDRSSVAMLDAKEALRDVMDGIGIPAKWVRSKNDVAMAEDQMIEQEQQQMMLDKMEQAAGVASELGVSNGQA